MSSLIKTQILQAEERLRLAMLGSDVNTLDELLAPELIFTNHLGQVLGKQDDLNAHQSGKLKVQVLTPSEQHIQLRENVAIVTVRVHLIGSYAGIASDHDFRFTRIWTLSTIGKWQVVAAHSSVVTQ
jgi:ketosteroid isomerase-like protein